MVRRIPGITCAVLHLPVLLAVAAASGCGGTKTTYDGFFVEVSASRGLPIDQVALWVVMTTEGRRQVTPRDPDQAGRYRFDTTGRDLSAKPYLARLVPGETFRGTVRIVALGYAGTRAVARATAEGDLGAKVAIRLSLAAVPEGCDADGDGFPDCSRSGCCVAGEPLADCNDQEAKATPIGFEDECTRCGFGATLGGDSVDDDCDGTPSTCRDEDDDQSRDCTPSWCDGESKGSPACVEAARDVDCDPRDSTVHPGAVELCDGKDNNCDGLTDETVTLLDWDGVTKRRVGDSCGTGACAGGAVECDLSTRQPRCSTDSLKATQEDCATPEDDNCNGAINDPAKDGCSMGDLDGDGVPDVVEEAGCPKNPLAKFHSEVFPDQPGGPTHAVPEPCCLGIEAGGFKAECDVNCDGAVTACAEDDADGDGFPGSVDCNDHDPTVHPGAPEKCGDGIDQDCKGGDPLCATFVDADGDGFSVGSGDCDDGDTEVNPWAPERCNGKDDDCDGFVDEGNPEAADASCGSSEGECRLGVSVCVHEEGKAALVECIGDVRPEEEHCDDKDNDCDGLTDESFAYDQAAGSPCADPEDKGLCASLPRVGQGCFGIGACGDPTGDGTAKIPGVVVCLDVASATCSTNPNGPDSKAKAETCNALDDDCDGVTDEDLTSVEASDCRKTGVCLAGVSDIRARCAMGKWSCDYSQVPGWEDGVETSCDEKDNNCDGSTDEPFTFTDGPGAEPVKKGAGCGTGECANGTVVCSSDHAGLVCDTSIQQAGETCDGRDNDCDGLTDEGFTFEGLPVWNDEAHTSNGHPACVGIGECARIAGHVECQGIHSTGCSTNPGGSEALDVVETCNGKDDDCDGATDEALTSVADSTCLKVGVCLAGIGQIKAQCDVGTWLCDYTSVPFWQSGVETSCDGRDNDCDGRTDEDFSFNDWDGTTKAKGDGCGTGECKDGKVRCAGDMKGLECSTGSLASTEVCDYQDDDCDGLTDEGFTYDGKSPGAACTGVGACGRTAGLVECHPVKKTAVCSTNPDGSGSLATHEVCNAKDDDCNGSIDDGLGIASTDCPCRKVGVCEPSLVVATCVAGGEWVCSYDKVTGYQSPKEQSCDGRDNDCDGQTDEDFTFADWDGTVRTKDQACGTGACVNGAVACRIDETGLACSTAANASPESCNGKDDNCDGAIDEGTDPLCADSLTCTQDSCSGGGCIHPVIAGWCLIGGTCYGSQVVHPTNPCLWCDPTKSITSWSYRADGTTCDADDSGCTQNDSCQTGNCKAGTAPSCAYLDEQCKLGTCVSTGKNTYRCDAVNSNQGATCVDGNLCTYSDKCNAGVCAGVSYSCDDAKPCTTDSCDGLGGCTHTVTDGCLISETCVAAGADNSQNPCQRCDTATSRTAWTNRPNNDPCEDGNPCTIGDKCSSGTCVGGVARNCSDGDPCTKDLCNPAGGFVDPCTHPVDAGAICNDAVDCTYGDACGSNGVCGGTPYTCSPLAACYDAVCTGLVPPSECSQVLQSGYCYVASQCWVSGTLDPSAQCRSCQPSVRTDAFSSRTEACEDGSKCTTGDTCAGGSCIPGTPTSCAQPNPDCRATDGACLCGSGATTILCDAAISSTCDEAGPSCKCGTGAACDPALKVCCTFKTTGSRCCDKLTGCDELTCGGG